MKRRIDIIAIVFCVTMAVAWPVLGAGGGHDGGGHGSGGAGHGQGTGHGSQEMGSSGHGMSQGGHSGMKIHSAQVEGYQFSYELIDMKERMKGMENMPEMKHTHHLMVYVNDEDGRPVENAKAGYLIEGPDGETQKAMSMGMGGGYGADVNFDKPGAYTIKTKVAAGDKTMMDSFEYEVK